MTGSTGDLHDPPSTPAEDLEDFALEEDYALNPQFVEMVIDAADRGATPRLRELVEALRAEDVADLMGFLSADYRREIIPLIPPAELAEIISELDTNLREEILEHVAPATLAKALGVLDSDHDADVVAHMEDDQRDQVLAAMSEVDRAAIETTLAYEDETAGRLMQREVLAAPQFWTVGQTIDHIRGSGEELPEMFFDVYVVDPTFKPVGAVPLSRLLRSPRDTKLADIMDEVTEIPVDMDQEEAAYTFNKYHLISAPVVDAGGRLVGQITVDDIVDVINEESHEDMLALAGVSDAGRDADIGGIIRSRLPWLIVNLATEALAATVVGAFQQEIAKLTALAVLMPIVSSLGGYAGTQALAVAVRGIAERDLDGVRAARAIRREALTACHQRNDDRVGCCGAGGAGLVSQSEAISLIVGMSMTITFTFVAGPDRYSGPADAEAARRGPRCRRRRSLCLPPST